MGLFVVFVTHPSNRVIRIVRPRNYSRMSPVVVAQKLSGSISASGIPCNYANNGFTGTYNMFYCNERNDLRFAFCASRKATMFVTCDDENACEICL